jgi:hypothetical protein
MTQVIALSRVSIPGIIVDGDSANGKTVHGRGAALGHTTAQTQQPAPCNNGENEVQANAGTQGKRNKEHTGYRHARRETKCRRIRACSKESGNQNALETPICQRYPRKHRYAIKTTVKGIFILPPRQR